MPELPEVETIRRDLSKMIVGKTMARVEVLSPKQVSPADFGKRLEDLKIKRLDRRAKLLIFELSDGKFIVVHLKLTGQFIYRERKDKIEPNKFTQVIFTFSDGSHLFFNDLRKFGYLRYANISELERIKSEYGVEPLTKEFNLAKFEGLLARRPRMKIKQLLMDQGLIAGLGNIYADEACFLSGIRPQRRIGSLSPAEIKKLWPAIPKILTRAIEKRGTSADAYVDAYGRPGKYESQLMVYGRGGQSCKKCQSKIVRITLGGRGAHYCPRCQR